VTVKRSPELESLLSDIRDALAGFSLDFVETNSPPDHGGATDDLESSSDTDFHDELVGRLPFRRLTVPGSEAVREWQRLRDAGDGWPVIIGSRDNLVRVAETYAEAHDRSPDASEADGAVRSTAEILAAAAALEIPRSLIEREEVILDGSEDTDAFTPPPLGEWPEEAGEPVNEPCVTVDLLAGQYLPEVTILVIPTEYGYDVPAHLRWGDWNDCPPPEYHVAMLRRWHERYGAELVGLSGDVVSLRVARRPETREAALALAREEYLYCRDSIDQGAETFSNRAAQFMRDPWWDLWWD